MEYHQSWDIFSRTRGFFTHSLGIEVAKMVLQKFSYEVRAK